MNGLFSFRHLTWRKVMVYSLAAPPLLAAYQGYKIRKKYFEGAKLSAPTGPTHGIEKVLDKWTSLRETITNQRFRSVSEETIKREDDVKFYQRIKTIILNLQNKLRAEGTENQNLKRFDQIKQWGNNLSRMFSPSPHAASKKSLWSGVISRHFTGLVSSPSAGEIKPPRRIKLLIMGDSLAAGVGGSMFQTPVLVSTVARTLSLTLGANPYFLSP
jgi:hypothetical protein